MASDPEHDYRPGDEIEVFSRMPFPEDNGNEDLEAMGDRWMLCPFDYMGKMRPRIGWTERWLPATVVEASRKRVTFRWELQMWYDWATGERLPVNDPSSLFDGAPRGRVRPRRGELGTWRLPSTPLAGSEAHAGGVEVEMSFIVFRWGSARFPIHYDAHSWGYSEGSTVSSQYIRFFFERSVVPKLGWNYEVLSVFIQNGDDFSKVSPAQLFSLCRGRQVGAFYFLWPVQSQQIYGDKNPTTAGYVEEAPLFDLVKRMEGCGIPTRYPHPATLWRTLCSKDWVPCMSIMPKYHVPLTTRVPASHILTDPEKAARHAMSALRTLQHQRTQEANLLYAPVGEHLPRSADWSLSDDKPECVVKLGFSYEGSDVRMVEGESAVVEVFKQMLRQPGYMSDSVYVQQRVKRVHLEVRCFVLGEKVIGKLFTKFARVDAFGYVRDYEKTQHEAEAKQRWFNGDNKAWNQAMSQIQVLTKAWHQWLLTQCAEPTLSVRIDYMLYRTGPGKADVWTGEVGELGYSMGGINPAIVFDALLDSILPDLPRASQEDAGEQSEQENSECSAEWFVNRGDRAGNDSGEEYDFNGENDSSGQEGGEGPGGVRSIVWRDRDSDRRPVRRDDQATEAEREQTRQALVSWADLDDDDDTGGFDENEGRPGTQGGSPARARNIGNIGQQSPIAGSVSSHSQCNPNEDEDSSEGAAVGVTWEVSARSNG